MIRVSCKRSYDSSDDEDRKCVKRMRSSIQKLLDYSLSDSLDSDDSAYSAQQCDTESPHDTPYADSKTESDTTVRDVTIEYECVTDSEGYNLVGDVSSGNEASLAVGAIAAALCAATTAPTAPDASTRKKNVTSSSERAEDSDYSSFDGEELARTKYKLCIQCNEKNNYTLFRFCHACYQKRKEFFPPRPKAHKKRPSLAMVKQKLPIKNFSQDSGIGSFESDILDTLPEQRKRKRSSICSDEENSNCEATEAKLIKLDSNRKSLRFNEQLQKVAGNLDIEKLSEDIQSANGRDNSVNRHAIDILKKNEEDKCLLNRMCIMCESRPKDGAFLHGATAHLSCCYECALKTWISTKCCPVCKKKLKNVVKIYF